MERNTQLIEFHEKVHVPYFRYRDSIESRNFRPGRDEQLAFEAAYGLTHFVEHLEFEPEFKKDELFKIVRDIANVGKHGVLTKKAPLVRARTHLKETTYVALYSDDEGPYGDMWKQVSVWTKSGLLNMCNLLADVYNLYINEPKLELHHYPTQAPYERKTPIDRNSATSLNFVVVRGVPFQKTIQMLQWDYEADRFECMDLKDAKPEFRVYEKPPSIMDVEFILPDHDPIIISIELTDEEEKIYESLPEKYKRLEIMDLLKKRGIISNVDDSSQ